MTAQAMDNGRPLNNNDEAMTLTEHLGELRRRILHSLAALAAGTLVSSFYIDEIVAVLTAPATNLYYMRPAEAFFIYIKIALACGVLIAAPVLFYELWAFLVPALTGRERSARVRARLWASWCPAPRPCRAAWARPASPYPAG